MILLLPYLMRQKGNYNTDQRHKQRELIIAWKKGLIDPSGIGDKPQGTPREICRRLNRSRISEYQIFLKGKEYIRGL